MVEIGPNNLWMFTSGKYSFYFCFVLIIIVVFNIAYKFNGDQKDNKQSDKENFPMLAAASRSTVSVTKPMAINRTINVMRSNIAKLATTAAPDKEMSDGQFSFQMLKIRSKEIREQMNIQYILFIMLFILGLYIVIVLKRSSSQNGSICGFIGLVAGFFWNSNKRTTNNERDRAEKYALSNLFSDRDKKLKRSGFNRIPQDENTALEQEEDEDDEEDVLEDFSVSRKNNTRLV